MPLIRRHPAHTGDDEGGNPESNELRWMLTYSDMITLLLALFIILYALSSVSPAKLQAVAAALREQFTGQSVLGQAPGPSVVPGQSGGRSTGSARGLGPKAPLPGSQKAGPTASDQLAHAAAEIDAAIQAAHLGSIAHVQTLPQGLVITLSADYLFATGHAAISPAGQALIRRIGAILAPLLNPIAVLGATDSRPIRTPRYPSNWQLGAMRAANVAQLLGTTPGFDPRRLLATTTSKYHPLRPNTSAANMAANRRVEIWVVRSSTLVTALLSNGRTASARATR